MKQSTWQLRQIISFLIGIRSTSKVVKLLKGLSLILKFDKMKIYIADVSKEIFMEIVRCEILSDEIKFRIIRILGLINKR